MSDAIEEFYKGFNQFTEDQIDLHYYVIYDKVTGTILRTVMEIDHLDDSEAVLELTKEKYDIPGLITQYCVINATLNKTQQIKKSKYLKLDENGPFLTTKDNMLFLTNTNGDRYA